MFAISKANLRNIHKLFSFYKFKLIWKTTFTTEHVNVKKYPLGFAYLLKFVCVEQLQLHTATSNI